METKIINEAKTISDAVKKLYGYDNGKSRKKFYDLISEKKIDISHLKKRIAVYPTIKKDCPVCGKTFETQVGNKGERTTCSYSCSNTYFRSGKSNPNWKGERYRTLCFEYHKKECIICGENKIVAVHHFDENHNNNEPSNLIPLCPTHHQYVHSAYKDEVMDTIIDYRNKFIGI
jgi:uncharacterized OB-fold protein